MPPAARHGSSLLTLGVVLLGAFLGSAGCPGWKEGEAASSRRLVKELLIPPAGFTSKALVFLRDRARKGCVGAGVARLHYLLDLFDHARFTRHEPSRRELLSHLGLSSYLSADVGPSWPATVRVLTALLAEAARLSTLLSRKDQRSSAEHLFVRQIRELLLRDLRFPSDPDGLLRQARFLKKLLRRGSPLLAPNARLRLYGWCAQAFRAAVRSRPEDRQRILSYCQYPLFEADPRDYFTSRERTLPHPPWTAYQRGMERLLREIVSQRPAGRLRTTARFLLGVERRFFELGRPVLPSALDPSRSKIPRTAHGLPLACSPLLFVDDHGISFQARRRRGFRFTVVRPLLTEIFSHAARRHLVVAAASDLLWQVAWPVIEHITHTGFVSMGMAVAAPSTLSSIEGTYWAHGKRLPVPRLAQQPLSLLVLAPWPYPRDLASSWNKACSRLWVTVSMEPKRLVISLRPPELPPTNAEADPRTPLRPACIASIPLKAGTPASELDEPARKRLWRVLARIRSSYPKECGLLLAASPDVTWGRVVQVAATARMDASGKLLWPFLALRADRPRCVYHPDLTDKPDKPNKL